MPSFFLTLPQQAGSPVHDGAARSNVRRCDGRSSNPRPGRWGPGAGGPP